MWFNEVTSQHSLESFMQDSCGVLELRSRDCFQIPRPIEFQRELACLLRQKMTPLVLHAGAEGNRATRPCFRRRQSQVSATTQFTLSRLHPVTRLIRSIKCQWRSASCLLQLPSCCLSPLCCLVCSACLDLNTLTRCSFVLSEPPPHRTF